MVWAEHVAASARIEANGFMVGNDRLRTIQKSRKESAGSTAFYLGRAVGNHLFLDTMLDDKAPLREAQEWRIGLVLAASDLVRINQFQTSHLRAGDSVLQADR